MYRTSFIDPDYRRDPKTDRYCYRCQRDLKPGQPFRYIAYELDRPEAIHADDWEAAKIEIVARRAPHLDAFVIGPVGMDCARKIGLEFTRETETEG